MRRFRGTHFIRNTYSSTSDGTIDTLLNIIRLGKHLHEKGWIGGGEVVVFTRISPHVVQTTRCWSATTHLETDEGETCLSKNVGHQKESQADRKMVMISRKQYRETQTATVCVWYVYMYIYIYIYRDINI